MTDVLLLATSNRGKAVEVERFFAERLRVQTLRDHKLELPPEEGSRFEDIALLKAEFPCRVLGVPTLADDSGLEVDALDGRPGVHSARYAPGTDQDRIDKLLEDLADYPKPEQRGARFVCAMAFAAPGMKTVVVRGKVEGRILLQPRGAGGFGYDPVFQPAGESRTMAELSTEEKQAISHRGEALRAIAPYLARHFSLEL